MRWEPSSITSWNSQYESSVQQSVVENPPAGPWVLRGPCGKRLSTHVSPEAHEADVLDPHDIIRGLASTRQLHHGTDRDVQLSAMKRFVYITAHKRKQGRRSRNVESRGNDTCAKASSCTRYTYKWMTWNSALFEMRANFAVRSRGNSQACTRCNRLMLTSTPYSLRTSSTAFLILGTIRFSSLALDTTGTMISGRGSSPACRDRLLRYLGLTSITLHASNDNGEGSACEDGIHSSNPVRETTERSGASGESLLRQQKG